MEIRKLNIVMSYPVQWDIYTVMKNYIQNFYDAIGCDNFMEHFKYDFKNNRIMLISDAGFSKEWLFYMGASTKRNCDKSYAGKFGEGFKVASLVAFRDFEMGVQMESRDWKLTVTSANDVIDGVNVKVLAYIIEERPFQENSILILSNATKEHYIEMKRQIDYFYYEGNPFFGNCITKNSKYAIFKARKYPGEKNGCGRLFVNYQYRVNLELPIIVCNHCFDISGDDRDRYFISAQIIENIITSVFQEVNAEKALEMLELCNTKWRKTDGKYNIDWYNILKILIHKVATDRKTRDVFLYKYGDKLVTTGFSWDTKKYTKKMAMEWYRKSEFYDKKKVVCNLFDEFNLPTIYNLCLINHGFDETAELSMTQQAYIKVLSHVATKYFGELICYKELPHCCILLNKEAPLLGKAQSIKESEKIINGYGLRVVTKVQNVYIQSHMLCPDRYNAALVVYLHELLHQYGGDSSAQFRKALVYMNKTLLAHLQEIEEFEREWRAIGNGIG